MLAGRRGEGNDDGERGGEAPEERRRNARPRSPTP